jgi:cytochrome c peroxidase
MKQKVILFLVAFAGSIMFLSVTIAGTDDIGTANTVSIYNKNAALFASSVGELYTAIKSINKDTLSVLHAKNCLKVCRIRYKRIAFFISYFFPSETKMYNAAPKFEVEEPELELEEPMGLQQIETLLFADDVPVHKTELLAQTDALYSSAKDLGALLYRFKANDSQVLESIRIELIRMSTLYISGYDAPMLKTGITETLVTSKIIQEVLQPYFKHGYNSVKTLAKTLSGSIKYLDAHQQFDSFNRAEYLQKYALPIQQQLGFFIKEQKLELNTSAYLNYNAANIFSRNFLKTWDSIPAAHQQQFAALGKRLFYDKALSGNLKVSCASCHQPQKFFMDGRVKSPSIIADSILKRNTPTLLYAGRQHSQFWDGRAKNLTEQVKNVVFNPLEMGGRKELLAKNILQNSRYQKAFAALMPEKNTVDIDDVALAISAFVISLSPMNSAFDHYIRGNKNAMTTAEIKGFNLFMGKAQCGTCHFAPYFNSLVPPLYDVSELEILGTTKTDNLKVPEYDTDMGRYNLYQIHYYKQAFKTPTVRNVQKTGPYMHNGAFKTLKSVLAFYNKGGGNGLGLTVDEQTLPSKPLNLSKQETDQIIQFINALTDEPQYKHIKSN